MPDTKTPQSYANHRRLVPLYHGIVFPAFTLNLAIALYTAGRDPNVRTIVAVAVAAALILLFLFARQFALTVQDRLIRLEERLRLATLLPAELKGRIGEFNTGQLVALRFASDEELPALAREVLEGRVSERDAIKKLIRNWRPDHLRV